MEDRGWGAGGGFSRAAALGVSPTHDHNNKIELQNRYSVLEEAHMPEAKNLGELGGLEERSLSCRTPVPNDEFDEWEDMKRRVDEFSRTERGQKAMEEACMRAEADELAQLARVPWRRKVPRHSGGKHFMGHP